MISRRTLNHVAVAVKGCGGNGVPEINSCAASTTSQLPPAVAVKVGMGYRGK